MSEVHVVVVGGGWQGGVWGSMAVRVCGGWKLRWEGEKDTAEKAVRHLHVHQEFV